MWWGSGSDPEGSGGESSSKEPPQAQSQQLLDLQEQFEQQQTFIAQLKEMLRKTEQSSSVSREKVEEYASTLNEINARAKSKKIRKSEAKRTESDESVVIKASSSSETSLKKSDVVTPAKEKINLLRQQLEENRVKLAQRDKNQKGIEEMVNQLKAQFDDSQIIINQSQMNIPKSESKISAISYTIESSKDELLSALKSKDDHIEELNLKVQQLQANVLDLQENVKEKDSVIDARTKAITLLSENLSKKGKNTLDMLDETKEQMRVMQQNFVTLEAEMKQENIKLQSELDDKEKRVQELLESNSNLESSNLQLHEKLTNLNSDLEVSKIQNTEFELKVEELNKLNELLQTRLVDLDESSTRTSPEKSETSSPQKTSKRSKSKKSKAKEPEIGSVARIAELEKLVEELKVENARKEVEMKTTESSDDEIAKLNKQLEEMNKNMIKMKAQHKAKLKELQKKGGGSSGPSDFSEKITNLEKENTKLGQRVAELEDEKGNLQLRLVDYESNKDKEYIADLENRIEDQKMEIENHIRTIKSLESQISTTSNETSSLRNELSKLMHLENAQVCSEMTSVQLEEQLDKEVSHKKEIQDKCNEIVKENEELLEKIENLNREKQELSTKLENYMQENMELIDRLEKLSAEKVSSAESIEIVEGLTQQEKLELEAYQKNLDFNPDKPNEGEHIETESNSELNESVSKLSEETSELMERIELFTVERREVMEKMDHLTAENNQLLSKLEKYECDKSNFEEKYNNLCVERDELTNKIETLVGENEKLIKKVLPSSDEEMQKELSEYRALLENQKLQISSLQEELWNKTDVDVEENIKLKEQYDTLLKSYEEIKNNAESNSGKMEEKLALEKELIANKERIAELEIKIKEYVEEIDNVDSLMADNKNEYVRLADSHAKLQNEFTSKSSEIENLNDLIVQMSADLDEKDKMCNNNDENVNFLTSQLEELKSIMTENVDQLKHYESEMDRNSKTIEDLNDQLEELNYKIVETEHIIELKNAEIKTLKSEKQTSDDRIRISEEELKQQNDKFADTCRQLKEKCKFLENQIAANSGSIEDIKVPFEKKINELEGKNRELVDKMKKIAANLKKKQNTCQELESKLAEFKEKWENESKEKDEKQNIIDDQQAQITENQNTIHLLLEQLKELETDITSLQDKIASKNNEQEQIKVNYESQIQEMIMQNNEFGYKIQNYEALNEENLKLKNDLSQYVTSYDNLQKENEERIMEINKLNEELNLIQYESQSENNSIVENLSQQLESQRNHYETTQNAMEAKIQEKELFIENLETENNKYKEKLMKLEEGISILTERKQKLEDKISDLKFELDAREEVSLSENILEQRLEALIVHDEIIAKKLHECLTENQTLQEKVKSLLEENDSLNLKVEEISLTAKENRTNHEKMQALERENNQLNEIVITKDEEIKKIHSDFERKLLEKTNEIESMESELSVQLGELNSERKNILAHSEVLEDKIKDYTANEQMLNDELDQLQQKLHDLSNDYDKKLQEIQELNHIKEQLEIQLSNSQRTEQYTQDDSHHLRAELENLQKIITQKDTDLKNYQQFESQLLQTQQFGEGDPQHLRIELENLQKVVAQKDTDIENYQRQIESLLLQTQPFGDASQHLSTELENLQKVIAQKDIDIQNYQRQNMQLQMAASFTTPSLFDTPSSSPFDIQQTQIDKQQIQNITEQLNSTQNELSKTQDKLIEISQLYAQSQTELETQKTYVNNLQHELTNQQMDQNVTEQLNSTQNNLRQTQEKLNEITLFYTQSQSELESQKTYVNTLQQQLTNQMSPNTAEQLNELKQAQEKLNELSQLYTQSQNELQSQKSYIDSLHQELTNQKDLLVTQTAHQGVTEIISAAEDAVTERQNFIHNLESQLGEIRQQHQQYQQQPNISQFYEEEMCQKQAVSTLAATPGQKSEIDNKDELLRKIKALEFMLYNAEREKDATLSNCHEFINELTRLVYEREKLMKEKSHRKPPSTEVDLGALQDQIVTDIVTTPEIKKELQNLEYSPAYIQNQAAQGISIVEEIIQPKSTYLCYTNDGKEPVPEKPQQQLPQAAWSGWGIEDQIMKQSFESQIVQPEAIPISPTDKKQLELLEFGQVHLPKDSDHSTKPVGEHIADPKHAYLCYPDTKTLFTEDTFASEEDGWGWNAEEAKLEAEHRQGIAAAAPPAISQGRLEQLEEKVHDLEVERSRLLEEIKTSQVRSGKLIKKLKELKQKNDTLTAQMNKKPSGDFDDLDVAIQDELNNQIKALEKKIKELSEENVKEKSEKDNINKRLDVVTSANERMIELKEKQDNEIQFLQFKNRELSSKLEQLEWGDDNSSTKSPAKLELSPAKVDSEQASAEYKIINDNLNKKIKELEATVNDLTLDNEDMQVMLEEQRNLRLEAEKALSNVPVSNSEKLEIENQNLRDDVAKLENTRKELEERIKHYVSTNDELNTRINELQSIVDNLTQENIELNNQMTMNTEQLQNENKELQNLKLEEVSELRNQIDHLQNRNIELQAQLDNVNLERQTEIKNQMEINQFEMIQLRGQITTLEEAKTRLENMLSEKETIVANLKFTIQQLEKDKSNLEIKLQEILNIQSADKSNDEKLQQMNEQLMTTLTELDNKNKELSDLNNTLNSERQISEQKLLSTVEQLSREWSERIDQRGADVAESWKLHLDSRENEFSQREESLKSELNEIYRKNEELLQQNKNLQQQIEVLINEKQSVVFDNSNVMEGLQQTINDKQNEIIELSQKLRETSAQLEIKNNEIINLQQSAELITTKDFEISKIKTQIIEKEEYYEELLSTKDSDLENMRSQLSEQENRLSKQETDKMNLQIQLEAKLAECNELEEKKNELNSLLQEESTQMTEMRQFIETQVLKIEELKKELYEKSNDYDALVAEFDSLHNQKPIEEKHVHFEDYPVEEEALVPQNADELQSQSSSKSDTDRPITDPVNRAELDLALYMLHQRDVRCEELTVELMQLLEERDTLQLRLSNAIRVNEEIRTQLGPEKDAAKEKKPNDSPPKIAKSTGAIPKSKSTAIVLGATNTELATEATETVSAPQERDKDILANKLSQLHKVGYRDKTLKDDQEIRHLQQLSIMQQHRDLASRLPPEAAARLVDASYTLSRDVQSPSKVLLNWLWGRSTPKVNDV